jgi:leader peptidase (prepilin peptidase)/N-methyltransferase
MLLIFIIGLVVGSFLNVCLYRLPRGESIVFPASRCPNCQHQLHFWDLIPVLSYLVLRGRCRYCGQQISWRYPMVEIITALLFGLIAAKFLGQPLVIIGGFFFAGLAIVAFFIDLDFMVIPDSVSVTGIFGGLVYNYLRAISANNHADFVAAIIGLLVGGGLLYLIGLVGKWLCKKEALGEGDLYLGAMLGAFLGWPNIILAIFLAYLIAGVFVGGLLLSRKVQMGSYVPFGPALVAGGIITFLFGQEIMIWYLSLMVG